MHRQIKIKYQKNLTSHVSHRVTKTEICHCATRFTKFFMSNGKWWEEKLNFKEQAFFTSFFSQIFNDSELRLKHVLRLSFHFPLTLSLKPNVRKFEIKFFLHPVQSGRWFCFVVLLALFLAPKIALNFALQNHIKNSQKRVCFNKKIAIKKFKYKSSLINQISVQCKFVSTWRNKKLQSIK